MGEICIESGACFPTFADAMAAQPGGGHLRVASGDYFEALEFTASYTIEKVDPSAFRPVLLHSPTAGAPILALSGPGVAVTVVGVDFDGNDGRVFEVRDGARLTLQVAFITSSANRSYGAVGVATDGSVVLQLVEIVGGSAAVGGQLYLQDSNLSVTSVGLTGGRGIATGVLDLVDTDGIPEHHVLEGLTMRDADVAFGQYALRANGDEVVCNNCVFERISGAVRMDEGDLEFTNSRFSNIGGTAISAQTSGALVVSDSTFEDVASSGILAQYIDSVDVSLTTFSRVNLGARVLRVPDARFVGDLFCAFGGDVDSQGLDFDVNSGAVLVANSRFIGGTSPAAIEVVTQAGSADVQILHNDFIGNYGQAVVSGEDYTADGPSPRDSIVDNLVVGQRGGTVLFDSDSLADVATNLGWDNGDARWTRRDWVGDAGFEGSPGWLAFDVGSACAMASSWDISPEGTWSTWRYAGRDAGSGALDRDGTPSDIGAIGGPDAFAGFWSDGDGDGWPLIYDCADDDAGANPGVPEQAYDGVDADCDGFSDFDADLDGYVSDLWFGDDCADEDASVNPGVYDEPNDALDGDCDGDRDADGDGYVWPEDCDDEQPAVHPGAVEDVDGVDRDCDGIVDVRRPLSPGGCSTGGGAPGWLAIGMLLVVRRRLVVGDLRAPFDGADVGQEPFGGAGHAEGARGGSGRNRAIAVDHESFVRSG